MNGFNETLENMMTEADLDAVYTRLCKTMTQVDEVNAPLFLARFALLAIQEIGMARWRWG